LLHSDTQFAGMK